MAIAVIPTTRCPTHASPPSPAASTTPQTSMPRVKGGVAMTAATPPRHRAMSPKFSDAAATATRTVPGAASGTGISSTATACAGSHLGGFIATAEANGGRVTYTIPGFLVIEDLVDGGGPVSQSVVDSLGAVSFASLPYPGGTGVAYPGIVAIAAGTSPPGYPL